MRYGGNDSPSIMYKLTGNLYSYSDLEYVYAKDYSDFGANRICVYACQRQHPSDWFLLNLKWTCIHWMGQLLPPSKFTVLMVMKCDINFVCMCPRLTHSSV